MAKGMKTCKYCGAEIAKGAKICPKCSEKNVLLFKIPLVWIGAITAVGVAAVVMSGGGKKTPTKVNDMEPSEKNPDSGTSVKEEKNSDSKVSANKDEKTDSKASSEEKNPEAFTVGDTVDTEGIQVKLNSVEFSDKNDFHEPDKGNCFIYVNLTVKNTDNEKLSVSPMNWHVEDSNGMVVDSDIFAGNDKKGLPNADLKPGGKVTGVIAFEVPKKDKNLKLQYMDEIFSDDPVFEFQIDGTSN